MRCQNYCRRQNIGTDKIIGINKILVSTNTGVDKILVRQNLGVDKKQAQRKCWRRRRRIPLLFCPAESTAADFSQTPLKIFYISRMVLLSVHAVVKCVVASTCPDFMGGLFPVLYRLNVSACHAENVTNFGADKISVSAENSLIFAKL
jgi:hypothetical protein